jgi:non-specific serine/threonine protein kinase
MLGPYEIAGLIGAGGMGEVYRARDTRLHRAVAIKILHKHLSSQAELRQRFQREARASSALSHPHICTVHDVGEIDGEPYLVLEHLEGGTLREALRDGPLPIDQAIRVASEVADGLDAAHRRGIVHRDIKPENVFLTARGEAKIMDFGLAAFLMADPNGDQSTAEMLTAAGAAVGTLAYMSPEQARGEQLDWRTDVFSFGVMVYEMTAGVRPFRGGTPAALFDEILHREPTPLQQLRPDAPQPLIEIAGRSLVKQKDERKLNAAEILRLLNPREARGSGKLPSAGARPLRARRRRAILAGAAALTLLLSWLVYRTVAPSRGIHSLAVLPFTGNRAENQDLALGLTEALIDEIARSEGLRVTPRAAVLRHRGAAKAAADLGRELGVDAVLEGSLDREGEQTSISAALVDARSGRTVWRQRYDPERSEVFAVRNRLAADVRGILKIRPTRAARSGSGETSANPEAYEFYLRGLAHTWRWNKQDTGAAIALLEKSAALDPGFAPTQALLSVAYGIMSFNYEANDPQWEEKGFAAARRALSADPDSPEAHYAQGMMLWRISHAFPAKEALAELRKALTAKPDFDDAWHQHGLILFHVGHLQAGMRDIDQALSLNPANTIARFRYGPILVYLQRYEDALAALNRVPRESYPTQWAYQRAWALISLGRLEEAEREVERSLLLAPGDQGGVLHACRAMIRAKRGDRRAAEADIATAVRVGSGYGHFHHTAYSIGAIYTMLGENDKAQEYIEQAARDGFPNFTFFETDPHLARLREVGKFQDFLKRLRREWERIPGEE